MNKRYILLLMINLLSGTLNATKKRTHEQMSQAESSSDAIAQTQINNPIDNRQTKAKVRKILLEKEYIAKGFVFSKESIATFLSKILRNADTETLTKILETGSEYYKDMLSNYAHDILESSASEDEKLNCLKKCLEHNPDIVNTQRLETLPSVNYRDNQNILHKSITTKSLKIIKFLLDDCNISIEQKTNTQEYTPLAIACFTNNIEIAEELINRGANTTQLDKNKNSLLHFATLTQNYHFIKKILDNKYNFNEAPDINRKNINGRTPVMATLLSKTYISLHILLSYNPDLNITDNNGITIQTYIQQLIASLIHAQTQNQQTPQNLRINELKSTLLVCLEYNLINTNANWYPVLIERIFPQNCLLSKKLCLGQDITQSINKSARFTNELDANGKTALMWAFIKSDDEQTTKNLLKIKIGAQENKLKNFTTTAYHDNFYQTPLSKALYLARKATTNKDKKRYTALSKTIYDYLIERRIILNIFLGNEYVDNEHLNLTLLDLDRSNEKVAKLQNLMANKEKYAYKNTKGKFKFSLGDLKLILKQAVEQGDDEVILAILPFEFNNNFNDIKEERERLLNKSEIDPVQKAKCLMLLNPDLTIKKHNVLNLVTKSSLEISRIKNRTRTMVRNNQLQEEEEQITVSLPHNLILKHIAPYIFGENPYLALRKK